MAPQRLAQGTFRFVCDAADLWFPRHLGCSGLFKLLDFFPSGAVLERPLAAGCDREPHDQYAAEDIFADIVARIGLYAGAVIVVLLVLSILRWFSPPPGISAVARLRWRAQRRAKPPWKRAIKPSGSESRCRKGKADCRKESAYGRCQGAQTAGAGSEQKAAERERLAQERREQKRAAAQEEPPTGKTGQAGEGGCRRAETAPEREDGAKPVREPEKTQPAAEKPKKNSNIADDTGFLDD
jgi:hypothetical protein